MVPGCVKQPGVVMDTVATSTYDERAEVVLNRKTGVWG